MMKDDQQQPDTRQGGGAGKGVPAAETRLDVWLAKEPPAWLAYGVAILCVLLGMLLDEADLLSGGFRVYLVFYPVIAIAALFGGFGPGLLAIALSALDAAFFLVEPAGRLAIAARADRVSMAVFIAGSLFIVWVCVRLRRAISFAAQAKARQESAAETARKMEVLLQETRDAKEAAENASRVKDQFIAALSHELRTPLTPVIATVTALEHQPALPADLRADMELVHRNVELEATLINDLLDVTTVTRGTMVMHPEVVDTEACLQTALRICQDEIEAKHLKVSLSLTAARHYVWADPARLRQVFWHLLRNAVKFTPEGGQISLRSDNDDGHLNVKIADTGIGIPPEILPRVFEPFEQGAKTAAEPMRGLGLGLSVARAIVKLHEGNLTVLSKGKDKGATFTVELATVPEVGQAPPPPVVSELRENRPQQILLVDDHQDTLQTVARLLRRWGYAVTTATSVHSALELVETENFKLIISDLGLPDGSGLEIMRQVKEHYNLHGIALSGYGTEEDIRKSREAGFTEHLVKPVNFDTLHAVIEKGLADAA